MTAEKKSCAESLVECGIASACQLADISRASYYCRERDWRKQDAAVIDAINNELKRYNVFKIIFQQANVRRRTDSYFKC